MFKIFHSNNISKTRLGLSCESSAGFTLLEILISVTIFAILFGLGLFVSFDVYKGGSLESEVHTLVSVLQKARSQSVHNMNQTRHGVHFDANPSLTYIMFECPKNKPDCTSYITSDTDIIVKPSYNISFVQGTLMLPFDVIFEQLHGSCATCEGAKIIKITDGQFSYNITVNIDGPIDWNINP